MPGPRFEAGGGGSQVEVTAGRERFLKRRAVVDSAPGRRLGASSREQAGLAVVSVSGACVQGLEEPTRCGVLRLGG